MRQFIKLFVRYSLMVLFGLPAIPWIILSFLEKWLTPLGMFFEFGAQVMAMIPGYPGKLSRAVYYLMTLDSFHPTADVSFGSFFATRKSRMGRSSGMGEYCVLGWVEIGSGVRMASRISIVSGLHEHGSTAKMGDIHSGAGPKMITIGDQVWVGEGATIGANVGEHSIVGLGSVIVNDVPPWSFAMGNPARILPTTRKPAEESK